MSDVVSWLAEVSIKSGQLDNFKALVEELVQWSQEDPKTLAYEWFLSEDNGSCHIYERSPSCHAHELRHFELSPHSHSKQLKVTKIIDSEV